MIGSAAYNFIKMMLEVFAGRFNVIPVNLAAEIETISTHEVLRSLHRYSAVCKSMDDFMEKLKTTPG